MAKVESITFLQNVKVEEIPGGTRNTQTRKNAEQILARLRSTPDGQAVQVKIPGSKKYTRYALQKSIRKLAGKGGESISVSEREGLFYISR